ncbi:MAG: hypothetical protein LBU85_07070 [Treponema sp.]|jgi:hypothetical protein|nr:hypothetical protein [Treponema sp.]
MNKTVLGACIFFVFLCPLTADDAFFLEPYGDLRPDINAFAGNTTNSNDRRSLLFMHPYYSSRNKPVFICDIPEMAISQLPDERMGIEERRMRRLYFWDPRTRQNYIYCIESFVRGSEITGWHLLDFSDGFLGFVFQDKNEDWAMNSPPNVRLGNGRVFSARYVENLRADVRSMYKSSFQIVDPGLNKTIWELNIASGNFPSLYWPNDNWYFQTDTSFFAVREILQYTIHNYETNETISFAPECIIGYGDGVVLTSTKTTVHDFIGITVWTPEKEVLYRDSNFSLTGLIDRKRANRRTLPGSNAGIVESYFDFPYIYINIGWGTLGDCSPFATLILNLMDGKTCYTSLDYFLCYGIFANR